jgi:hypothetical protein
MAAVVWGLYPNLARRWTANDEAGSSFLGWKSISDR